MGMFLAFTQFLRLHFDEINLEFNNLRGRISLRFANGFNKTEDKYVLVFASTFQMTFSRANEFTENFL